VWIMNRIVIIGNGFDLAHNLETGYEHFIGDFWETEIKLFCSSGTGYWGDSNDGFLYGYQSNFIKIYTKKLYSSNNDAGRYGYAWFERLNNFSGIRVEVKNAFLEVISKKHHLQKWVDIEEEYYNELRKCLDKKRMGDVKKLNEEFLKIKTLLEIHLGKISDITYPDADQIIQHLKMAPRFGKTVDDMIFLNFNYTDTINFYADSGEQVIHIHGKLNDPDNPIIFGYGDELDENHKLIENINDNEYLKHIKSIEYLKTNNYKKLQAFMESDEYEIFIMGHSCGISDRTLLNHLFEHKHCKSIKVFYYKEENGTDNYNDLVCNIYRNFNDKNAMRIKVVSKDGCKPLLERTKQV